MQQSQQTMKTNSPQAWIAGIRPYSLVNSVLLVSVGTALARAEGGFDPVTALLCLLFALLMQCTANLVNDLCDFLKGADRPDRLGPDRTVAKGLITPGAMKRGIALCTLAAAACGCGILWRASASGLLRYGGWELAAAGAACMLCAFLYTAGPRPLAYLGLGDAAVLLFFGIVPVGFTCYVQSGRWTPEVTLIAAACGLAIDTMLWINNFRDREQDARCGKRTLVVRLGRTAGRRGYLALGVAAIGCCLTAALLNRSLTLLLPLLYLPPHVAAWRRMLRIDHGRELNVCLGETARNILLFGLLLTAAILIG